MWVETIRAHAFGPLSDATLEFGPGLNVVAGDNESAKSSWHAAMCAAIVGRRRGRGASTLEDRRFAELHKPWDAPGWRVSAVLDLDDGRRIEMTQDLDGKVDCSAMDLGLGRDLSSNLIFEGSPDGSRMLGLDRRSFTATAVVNQTQLLSVLEDADGLQEHLQRAAATAGADSTAAAALDAIARYQSEHVGLDRANSTKPLRSAIIRRDRAQRRYAEAVNQHESYLELVKGAHELESTALEAETESDRAKTIVEALRRIVESLNAAALADSEAEHALEQDQLAALAERSLADRIGKVRRLLVDLGDTPHAPGTGRAAPSGDVAAALAALRSAPEVHSLSGRAADEIRAELESLPQPPDGDRRPDPTTQARCEAFDRARSILQAHDRQEPPRPDAGGQPEVMAARAAGPSVLRDLAARLRTMTNPDPDASRRLNDELTDARKQLLETEAAPGPVTFEGPRRAQEATHNPAGRKTRSDAGARLWPYSFGVAVGLVGGALWLAGQSSILVVTVMAAALLLLGAAALIGHRRGRTSQTRTLPVEGLVQAEDRTGDQTRAAVDLVRRRVAELEGRLAAQKSLDASADALRGQLLARAAAAGLPSDPEHLLELAEIAEHLTITEARWQRWEELHESYSTNLHQTEAELRAALKARGESDDPSRSVLDLYHDYEERCRQRSVLADQAARRPHVENELTARLAAEGSIADDRALRDRAEATLRDMAESVGIDLPVGTPIAEVARSIESWQRHNDEEQAQLRERQLRWTEFDALLDGSTVDELETRMQTVPQERARRAGQLASTQRALTEKRDTTTRLVDEARDLGLELATSPTLTIAKAELLEAEELKRQALARSLDLSRAAERALGTSHERARTLDSVAEAEEELAAAEAELEHLKELDETLSLTRGFLADAQTRVHQDIAPILARTLRKWLPSVTLGRYVDAIVDPATLKVQVCGPGRRWRDADRLSIGTAEQVYLLLRVALAEHLANSGESCPLLLDDVTVQADKKRTEEILNLLLALSSDRQIVLFAQEEKVEEWARAHLQDNPRHRLMKVEQVTTV